MKKYKIYNIEKSLIPKNKGYLISGDSIYIKTMLDLAKIIQVKDEGDLNPGTRIFITKNLYKKLNMSKEEIERIINKYKEKPIEKQVTKSADTVPGDKPEENSNETEIIIEESLPSQLLQINM